MEPEHGAEGAAIRPGVAAVIAAFHGHVIALSRWMTTPNSNLAGTSPAEALTAGHAEQVVDVAATLTAAGW